MLSNAHIELIVEESVGAQQNLQAIATGTADLAFIHLAFIQMDAAAF
ncbi:hypothetical protein [Thalassoporum mexicanum]|nr:hypothetical protein [Pseudanabaena sp. PCC 7367]